MDDKLAEEVRATGDEIAKIAGEAGAMKDITGVMTAAVVEGMGETTAAEARATGETIVEKVGAMEGLTGEVASATVEGMGGTTAEATEATVEMIAVEVWAMEGEEEEEAEEDIIDNQQETEGR